MPLILLFFIIFNPFQFSLGSNAMSKLFSQNKKEIYKIGIIVGSTRPNKIGGQVAEWVLNQIDKIDNLHFKLINLEEWNLPLFNEPGIPAQSNNIYVHEHTKKWSKEIASYNGFIFVTPQYNWGYPASLKNALDYLYVEWKNKPAIIISYAYRGGGKAAGQLKEVLNGLGMKVAVTMPAISLSPSMFNENKKLKDPKHSFSQYSQLIKLTVKELTELLIKK